MVSNILSWVELLRSGVVSELHNQKTRQKYVQTALTHSTRCFTFDMIWSWCKVTCLLCGHRENCCSWCTVYWRTPASGRAHSPTVWLVFANLHIQQSKQTQNNVSLLPHLCVSYKARLLLNTCHRLISFCIHLSNYTTHSLLSSSLHFHSRPALCDTVWIYWFLKRSLGLHVTAWMLLDQICYLE